MATVEAVSAILKGLANNLRHEEMTLRQFFPHAWEIIEPGVRFVPNWHVELMFEYLEAVSLGQIKRLVINVPPRTAKSSIVSTVWPVWAWTRSQVTRWLFVSYSASLSTKFSVSRRRIIESDWYQCKWGNVVQMAPDQNRKDEFENTRTGTMIATSTGGTVTGKGGNIIVMDDPINPEEAESEAMRDASNEFYRQTLVTRLNNKKKDAMVLVMQRLHSEDTTGYVLKEGGWEHVEIQAMAEKDKKYIFPLSQKEVIIKEGEYLCPEREGEKEFNSTRRAMGTRAHEAQYQQRPTSSTGNLIKRKWFKYWKESPSVRECDAVLQSWDMAFKDEDDSSYVVGQVWALVGSRKFLLDQVRDHMDYPTTKAALLTLTNKWPDARLKLVEDKANGPAVISDLERTVAGIVPISPQGSKIVRANAVSPTIEAGNVFLPDPEHVHAPWVHDFIEEVAAFPKGPHDDQVDAMSQSLVRLNEIADTKLMQHIRDQEEELSGDVDDLMDSDGEVFND